MSDEQRVAGTVVAGYGGFYRVRITGGTEVECRGRGRLRQTHSAILTGDEVFISRLPDGSGRIEQILPRYSQLLRPHIANVDLAVIVLAWKLPDHDLLLLDNMLLMCRLSRAQAVICFNKIDLMEPGEQAELDDIRAAYASAGYPLFTVSVRQGLGVDMLARQLRGKRSVLAGPSGVGKSSLLNCLLPEEHAETGDVSQRLQRGKHTTRYVRLLPLPGDDSGGMLADSPGFFVLDTPSQISLEQLPQLYPEYQRLFESDDGCRFDGCRHDREPDCAVRRAVEQGELDAGRYQRYLRILHEIKDREVKYK